MCLIATYWLNCYFFLITFLSLGLFVLSCVVSGAVDCVLVILLPLELESSSCSCCFIARVA